MTPPPRRVDLNADLGESFGAWAMGDDAALLGVVTSANVACGFHAGDPSTIRRACAAAAARGVAVGAHVAYPDLAGFGRRRIDMDPDELADAVLYQVAALDGVARAAGGAGVAHVKPHGALYHVVAHEEEPARAVVAAVAAYNPNLYLYGLAGSVFAQVAEEAGLVLVAEAFADRAYTAAGTLVDRRRPGAVLHDPEEIAARAVRLVVEGRVGSVDGPDVAVDAATVCLHGDTPHAVDVARAVRDALRAAGVELSAARPRAGP